MSESIEYGVWITESDGSNGRWMSDWNTGAKVWAGTEEEANDLAAERRHVYPHLRYEVRRQD